MKTLIISEDSTFINKFDEFFSQKGFDTIIYKWLLKALDNIEEIRPNCVILSSSEYPRHWKTLVQFIKSGIGGDEIAVYLYEPNPLSEKDQMKAKTLGINGFVSSFEDDELNKLDDNLNEFFDLKSIPLDKLEAPSQETFSVDSIMANNNVTESETKVSGTGSFIFTHPVTGSLINGEFFDKNANKITVKSDNSIYDSLSVKSKIEFFSYDVNDKVTTSCAFVNEIMNINDEKFIIFELDE